MSRVFAAFVASIFVFACSGPQGPAGADGLSGSPGAAGAQGPTGAQGATGDIGGQGPQGDAGPPGPITSPPRVLSAAPGWGSANTEIRLTGQNFSPDAPANRVTFDGVAATVLTATATELTVKAGGNVLAPRQVAISVEVAQQVSNAVEFLLVPSGTPRAADTSVPAVPSGVVQLGAELFVAAQALTGPAAGLYKVAADGTQTRVVRAASVDIVSPSAPGRIYDAPVALATDGTDVFYTTAFGSLRRYQVSTGVVSELATPNNANGNAFPALSGVARSASGWFFIVNRNQDGGQGGVARISPAGVMDELNHPSLRGGFGIAVSGTTLYLTIPGANTVSRVTSAEATPAFSAGWATAANGARGIAVAGTQVVVSASNGQLLAVPASTGGALTAYGAAGGYAYPADGLFAAAGGDLFLAQPGGGAVRKIATGQTAATIVSAGLRPAFATARLGARWYLATIGPAIFGGGPLPLSLQDSALLEVGDDGTSRIVRRGGLFSGLAVDGTQLLLSDCLDARIVSLDVATGTATDVLTATDGLTCPAGLAVGAGGEVLYVNTTMGGPGSSRVGRKAGSVHNGNFITNLPGDTLFLTLAGGKVLTMGLGPGGSSGLYGADATSGGTAAQVIGPAVLTQAAALGVSPSGTPFIVRFGGGVYSVDLTGNRLLPFGSTLTQAITGGGGQGPQAFSFAFRADGTLWVADFGQQAVVAVAP